jgi:hypothetical protein
MAKTNLRGGQMLRDVVHVRCVPGAVAAVIETPE